MEGAVDRFGDVESDPLSAVVVVEELVLVVVVGCVVGMEGPDDALRDGVWDYYMSHGVGWAR